MLALGNSHRQAAPLTGDSTGRAYFTGAEAISLGLAPEADPEGEDDQAQIKPKGLFLENPHVLL